MAQDLVSAISLRNKVSTCIWALRMRLAPHFRSLFVSLGDNGGDVLAPWRFGGLVEVEMAPVVVQGKGIGVNRLLHGRLPIARDAALGTPLTASQALRIAARAGRFRQHQLPGRACVWLRQPKGERQLGKWIFEPVGGAQGLTDD